MLCKVNGQQVVYTGGAETSLLVFLREELGICSPKSGCSGQGVCGACLVEVNGAGALACKTPMAKLENAEIVTIEGFPESLKDTLAKAFVKHGAVQCGFCTPGFLTRAKLLLHKNGRPTREEVIKAIRPNLCRCTGYTPLIDAILEAAEALQECREITLEQSMAVGASYPKYGAYEKALGQRPFVDDLRLLPVGPEERNAANTMLHGALVFCEHPRARLLALDIKAAQGMPGVERVLTAHDVEGLGGSRKLGMFRHDWPQYIAVGEINHYIGDVLACVVAQTEEQARKAATLVKAEYEVLEPVTDREKACADAILVHPEYATNTLLDTQFARGGDIQSALAACAHTVEGTFTTPFIEHAFLEPEACLAMPELVDGKQGLRVFSQGQGIWHDKAELADFLNLSPDLVQVTLVDAGGAFGGKEDTSVQSHAALAAWLLRAPVKVKLSRPESLRMHPKRHPMTLKYILGCDAQGLLQAAQVRVLADAGAYASVSEAVVARTGTHATSAYHVPCVDVQVKAVYTNNVPAGAFRGFGVNQSNFAMESLMDELAHKAGIDLWDMRFINALEAGKLTATGQILGSAVALKECLLALKPEYDAQKAAHVPIGLSCAMKNAGIGNGIPEPCSALLHILPDGNILLDHGFTEMGQGIHTIAMQILAETLGITPADNISITVRSDTTSGTSAGSTTASRGTVQLGHSILSAAKALQTALLSTQAPTLKAKLASLCGQSFQGSYNTLGRTNTAHLDPSPSTPVINHLAYSFAATLLTLNSAGKPALVLAAHDSGTVINKALYQSQISGGIAMALGYAMSEQLPFENGLLTSNKLSACGLLRASDMPEIRIVCIEKPDPEGPLGAKGLGEIAAIPATAAYANAWAMWSGKRAYNLPVK